MQSYNLVVWLSSSVVTVSQAVGSTPSNCKAIYTDKEKDVNI